MSSLHFHPGEIVPISGQYAITSASGVSTGAERTLVKSERFPPTPHSGQCYRLVDPTRTH